MTYIDEKTFLTVVTKVQKSWKSLSNCKPLTRQYKLSKISAVKSMYMFNHICYDLEEFDASLIPSTITKLKFFDEFNSSFGNLPDSIIQLGMGDLFNTADFVLPRFLVKLFFGAMFNQKLPPLPATLKVLKMLCTGNFNQPLPDPLPELTVLETGFSFNGSIDHIPDSIQDLKVGSKFKSAIKKWPRSLKIVQIPAHYAHPLTDLPQVPGPEPITVWAFQLTCTPPDIPGIIWKL